MYKCFLSMPMKYEFVDLVDLSSFCNPNLCRVKWVDNSHDFLQIFICDYCTTDLWLAHFTRSCCHKYNNRRKLIYTLIIHILFPYITDYRGN